LQQLRVNKKSVHKRIEDEKIHVSISRSHLHTGEYNITIGSMDTIFSEETFMIESDFIPEQPKPTNNPFF